MPNRSISGRGGIQLWVPILIAALCCIPLLSAVAEETESPGPSNAWLARQTLIRALSAESQANSEQRGRLIQSALALAPDYAPARWHAGQVQIDDKWYSVEQAMRWGRGSALLGEYQSQRADTDLGDADELLSLAEWCRRKGLHDEVQAHLQQAVRLAPNNAAVRRKAGYRWVQGDWITEWELELRTEAAKRQRAELRQWMPTIVKLKSDYRRGARGNDRLQEQALQRLWEIDDVSAIGPLSRMLGVLKPADAIDLELYGEMIGLLGSMPRQEATTALAYHAVMAPTPELRMAAAEYLQDRQLEAYVPDMLSAMTTTVRVKQRAVEGEGNLVLNQTIAYREGMDKIEVEYFERVYEFGMLFASTFPEGGLPVETPYRVDLQNAHTKHLNWRISDALQIATGHANPPLPEAWWEWWNSVNDYSQSTKPVRLVRSMRHPAILPPAGGGSCFAAGTLVWTIRGAVPIESIRGGDRVLSQDPETGELDFKVVLHTTFNREHELLEVACGGETLRATPGHPFWVSGAGWQMASELDGGDLLHTPHGSISFHRVRSAPNGPTHNLVVEDFHTYFVGQAGLLVHDVTQRAATRAVIPGFAGRE